MDGIYSIRFRGAADWGMGLLMFRKGKIVGADVAGVQYDGTYSENEKEIFVQIVMSVPAGVTLVQGYPAQPKAFEVPFEATVAKLAIESSEPILMRLPHGPVNVIFSFLRELND